MPIFRLGAGGGTAGPQNKLDATGAPTANDDSSAGYSINSEWIDVTNDKAYKCVDDTVGAAVWVNGTAEVGGASTSLEPGYHFATLSSKATTNNNMISIAFSPITGTYILSPGPGHAYESINLERSTDGGQTWTASVTITGKWFCFFAKNINKFVAVDPTYGKALKISDDDGLTWRNSASGLYPFNNEYFSIPLWIESTGRYYLYKGDGSGWWTTDFETFNAITTDIIINGGTTYPAFNPSHIAGQDYKVGDKCYVSVGDNKVGWTIDGENWTVNTVQTSNRVRRFIVDNNGDLFAINSLASPTKGMYKSTDEGLTWTLHSERFDGTPTGQTVTDIYWGYLPAFGAFVTANTGYIHISYDGKAWVQYPNGTGGNGYYFFWIPETKQLVVPAYSTTQTAVAFSR